MSGTVESARRAPIRLSICIATYGRAAFIGQTLEAILAQADERVEVIVVDGASPDDTSAVVGALQVAHPRLVYHRELSNEGVDRDFDKAVEYACGDYCWLMSDDDILVPDAIATVLACLADEPELVVVNAEIRNKDLTAGLKPNQLDISTDCEFSARDQQSLFMATADYLSFIGAVVIRRVTWLARERAPYFGSLFIHMGVIFQRPLLGRAKVIARPLIQIRYGNALWTARGFEIWIDKWPRLIWSFEQFSEAARNKITARYPAKSLKTLLWYRAIGAYSLAEYEALLAGGKGPHNALARMVAALPARAVNAAVALYCLARQHADPRLKLYDLVRAGCASSLTRWAARRSRFPETEK
jgi:abequosyltransferase